MNYSFLKGIALAKYREFLSVGKVFKLNESAFGNRAYLLFESSTRLFFLKPILNLLLMILILFSYKVKNTTQL